MRAQNRTEQLNSTVTLDTLADQAREIWRLHRLVHSPIEPGDYRSLATTVAYGSRYDGLRDRVSVALHRAGIRAVETVAFPLDIRVALSGPMSCRVAPVVDAPRIAADVLARYEDGEAGVDDLEDALKQIAEEG